MSGEYFYKISGIFCSELLLLHLVVVGLSGSIPNTCLVAKGVISLLVDMDLCYSADDGKGKQLLLINSSYCLSRRFHGIFLPLWQKQCVTVINEIIIGAKCYC